MLLQGDADDYGSSPDRETAVTSITLGRLRHINLVAVCFGIVGSEDHRLAVTAEWTRYRLKPLIAFRNSSRRFRLAQLFDDPHPDIPKIKEGLGPATETPGAKCD